MSWDIDWKLKVSKWPKILSWKREIIPNKVAVKLSHACKNLIRCLDIAKEERAGNSSFEIWWISRVRRVWWSWEAKLSRKKISYSQSWAPWPCSLFVRDSKVSVQAFPYVVPEYFMIISNYIYVHIYTYMYAYIYCHHFLPVDSAAWRWFWCLKDVFPWPKIHGSCMSHLHAHQLTLTDFSF